MNRRYGLFLPAVLTWLLLPCAGWGAQANHAVGLMQHKIALALKVECSASSPTVRTGQSVTLTAEVQGASTGLSYSFSTNGGKLYSNGSTARLDTTGVPAGTAITATCQVVDGLERRSSADVTVHVISINISHARPPIGGAVQPPEDRTVEAIHQVKPGSEGTVGQDTGAAAQIPQSATSAAPKPSGNGQAASETGSSNGGSAGPSRAPAAVAAPEPVPPPPAAEGGNVYQQAEQVQQWKNQLRNGKIDYLIPSQMKLHDTAVVKVVVHGIADTAAKSMAGATTGTLKVSPRMQVQLSAEDNPDEFEIDPKVGEIQFVPIDGSATWMWQVTPKQPAQNQTLTIRALLVYPDKGEQIEQEITSYTAKISVSVPGFWASLQEAFWNDPGAAMKYVLPGGAGFTAIAGLVVWLWKRRHPAEAKTDKKTDDA
ncbi:MAG: hypothetical protein BGO25_12660 [Acidobacteriales bacterium 59-55]|nr:hypothetical protein [Terriglobales bacterium]OJV43979.1 MAG: hypothetical protein BGO25_12660 [Acidobacteriales bacterium 59-55]